MALFNELAQVFVKYNGAQNAPIGSYFNPRTLAYYQLTSDGVLPQDGTWFAVTTSGTSTATQIANAINAGIGTSYVAANLHSHTSADLLANPGVGASDA